MSLMVPIVGSSVYIHVRVFLLQEKKRESYLY